MIRVRLRKDIEIERLGISPATFVTDSLGRISQMLFDYSSIRVQADLGYVGTGLTPASRGYVRTVHDQEDWMIVTRTLTSAELLALRATPIDLVAAPGVGNAIVPISIFVDYKFGTIAYTVASCDVQILVGASAWAFGGSGELIGILDDTASSAGQVSTFGSPTTLNCVLRTAIENLPLKINNLGAAELLAGDGTMAVTVIYRIIALA